MGRAGWIGRGRTCSIVWLMACGDKEGRLLGLEGGEGERNRSLCRLLQALEEWRGGSDGGLGRRVGELGWWRGLTWLGGCQPALDCSGIVAVGVIICCGRFAILWLTLLIDIYCSFYLDEKVTAMLV